MAQADQLGPKVGGGTVLQSSDEPGELSHGSRPTLAWRRKKRVKSCSSRQLSVCSVAYWMQQQVQCDGKARCIHQTLFTADARGITSIVMPSERHDQPSSGLLSDVQNSKQNTHTHTA